MDERRANIDLVFRNGLKDYEVLPPREVWNSIQPAIKVKPKPFTFIRAAALVATLVTVTVFAYRSGKEILTVHNSPVLAFDVESASPLIKTAINVPAYQPEKAITLVTPLQKSLGTSVPENIIPDESVPVTSPANTKTNNLLFSRIFSKPSPILAYMTSTGRKSITITPVLPLLPQYISEPVSTRNSFKWSVAAMASPTFYSSFSSGNDVLTNQLAASEKSLVSYSGGLAVSYKLNKRFSIQTGLYYASLGQEVSGINSFGGFQKYDYTKGDHNFAVLTTSGTVYTDNPDVFLIASGSGNRVQTVYTNDVFDPKKANLNYINNTLLQNFSFLELPVVLRYKIITRAIDVNLLGGISYNMLVGNSAYTTGEGGKYPIGKTEGLNQFTVSSSLGMGLGYNFSDKLSFNLEPTFRYYLNPFSDMNGINSHPYSFGIFSGLSYKF
jgi:hypothetical protein